MENSKTMTLPKNTVSPRAAATPQHVASWWSVAEDLLWPEKRVKDKIRRRADALAAAGVDTVIQFGFHFRFDFAPYFGAMHGYFREIAEALHERNIRFLDHYSCNLIARPASEEERIKYHTFQRHHVTLYPDAVAATTAGYGGFRFNDLREIDIVTGAPAYTSAYQAELFCHNNPDFLAMHEAYLKRQLSEIPLDGLQQDDMGTYNFFRSCGCRHCRERFLRGYGHVLPPVSDAMFWGDTRQNPRIWGNYENPAFRDWIRMRYSIVREHLVMVKRVLGEERTLLTCCSCSGPQILNSLGLSYEHFIEPCDWVMLENCGLDCESVHWARMEPEAALHKSIGFAKSEKSAPAVACSYAVYDDSAYLGWALAHFWGVVNWISTLRHDGEDNPDDKEEAALIGSLNEWDRNYDKGGSGEDIVEVAIAFLGANKENGFASADGQEYWLRAKAWSLALLEKNIGYRFVTSREVSNLGRLADARIPLILDSCSCVSDQEHAGILAFLARGGQMWVVPPFGTHDERGNPRKPSDHDTLSGIVRTLPLKPPADLLKDLIQDHVFEPRIVVTGANQSWKIRLRKTSGGLTLYFLNQALEGVPHPTAMDRWGQSRVLETIRSTAVDEPVSFTLDTAGLAPVEPHEWKLYSPEIGEPRSLDIRTLAPGKFRFFVSLTGIRLYACVMV